MPELSDDGESCCGRTARGVRTLRARLWPRRESAAAMQNQPPGEDVDDSVIEQTLLEKSKEAEAQEGQDVEDEKSKKVSEVAVVSEGSMLGSRQMEVEFKGDENTQRGNWGGKLDFLLSCIGYAVGLGNIWRFPYLCYKNGGGAFLIPYIFFTLLMAWALVFLCLIKGVKSSGKVVYVTAIFPYVILVILCIRGVTLPGALNGIKFYLFPKWQKLLEISVWSEAAMQIFYSIGAAWGALITMSSYNKFRNNCYRDAIIVPLLNCGTSIFAGLVIFSIIGFIQKQTGSAIEDVVDQGPGLIFVVYPEALTKIFLSPLWSVMFFLMIFTVGLDSQFGMFETMIAAFVDEYPVALKNKKLFITLAMVLVEFAIGCICVTRGGMYFLQIMDWYSSTFSLMIISFFECIIIGWVYGADRFYNDIELMIGRKPALWWKICWRFITPLIILFIFLTSLITHKPVRYGPEENPYYFPNWAVAIGICMALMSLLPLPIVAGLCLWRGAGTDAPAPTSPMSLRQRLANCLAPSPDYGPMVQKFREQWLATLTDEQRERAQPTSCWGSKVSCVGRDSVAVRRPEPAPGDKSAPSAADPLFAIKVTVQSHVTQN